MRKVRAVSRSVQISFEGVAHRPAQLLRILHVLQAEAMLGRAGNGGGGGLDAAREGEHVVWHVVLPRDVGRAVRARAGVGAVGGGARAERDAHAASLDVDVGSEALDEGALRVGLADGFCDRSVLDRADGRRRKHRREDKVVAR